MQSMKDFKGIPSQALKKQTDVLKVAIEEGDSKKVLKCIQGENVNSLIESNIVNDFVNDSFDIWGGDRCRIFLMASPSPTDKHTVSDENKLFLYKNSNGKVFYHIQNDDKPQYLEGSIFTADAIFISDGSYKNLCTDKQIISSVLNITSKRGHTCGDHQTVKEFTTPLGLACYKLDYDVVKALLENGANPNIPGSDFRSLVEMIMIGVGRIDLSVVLNSSRVDLYNKEYILHVDEKPLTTKTINHDVINTAGRILDLLLCHDLNPDFEWTEPFNQCLIQLRKCKRHIVPNRSFEECLAPKKNSDVGKSIIMFMKSSLDMSEKEVEAVTQAMAKPLERLREKVSNEADIGNKKDIAAYNLLAFIDTVDDVQQKTYDAFRIIEREKTDLLFGPGSGEPKMVPGISKDIAKSHHAAKSSVSFWKPTAEAKPSATQPSRPTPIFMSAKFN
jgi:hypothetical protein